MARPVMLIDRPQTGRRFEGKDRYSLWDSNPPLLIESQPASPIAEGSVEVVRVAPRGPRSDVLVV